MNIACCIDNNYVIQCGVLITSIIENNKNEYINFHIITAGFSVQNEELLNQMGNSSISITIHTIDSSILKSCPIREADYVSLSTYFRILIPKILPNLDKIIYLDCDIIVTGSLKELWDIDISEYAVGAVLDMLTEDIRNYNRLNYSRVHNYFNAGVLLINIQYWIVNNITNTTLDFIIKNPDAVKKHDQDALNKILHNKKLLLPLKFNLQDGFLYEEKILERSYWDELEEAIKYPIIIHYTGSAKPWFKDCVHPYKEEYHKMLNKTIWKNKKACYKNNSTKAQLKRLLARIGFLNPPRSLFRNDLQTNI